MVRAMSNKFTTGEEKLKALSHTRVQTRLSNGEVTTTSGTTSHREDYHARTGKSSNNFRQIEGIRPFRDPSNYQRRMINLVSSTPASYTTVTSTFSTYFGGYPQSTTYSDQVNLWSSPLNELGTYQDNNPMNQAVVECLVKLQDNKVQMGTYLAESVKAANQIADLGSAIARDLLDYSRRIRSWKRNPWGISREVADGYLGFKYGIKPLASELYAMSQLWNAQSGVKPLVISASHNVVDRVSKDQDRGVWTNRNQRSVHLAQCKIFATINAGSLRQLGQLGLVNPASVAWELVPYSFVFDWVVPVGSFLEALSARVGLTFLSGYKMQRTSFKNIGERKPPTGAIGNGFTLEYEGLSMKRERLAGFPTPIPYVKNPFSTSNVLSAAALFRQLLRGR